MGNAAVAEELPGADELDELYRLDATDTQPEPEEDGEDEGDGETIEPEDRPHP